MRCSIIFVWLSWGAYYRRPPDQTNFVTELLLGPKPQSNILIPSLRRSMAIVSAHGNNKKSSYHGRADNTRTTQQQQQVPAEIGRPDYAVDGIPKGKGPMLPWMIEVKSEEDIAGMRAAGRVARWDDLVSRLMIAAPSLFYVIISQAV